MMKQGGGVTRHVGVTLYVDLVVGDLTGIGSEYPQTAEMFAAVCRQMKVDSRGV
jgi:hypothetical protein